MASNTVTALLFGDSHVRRLGETFVSTERRVIDVRGFGGYRSYHLFNVLSAGLQTVPDVVFLHAGGNDLDGDLSPEVTFQILAALVDDLHGLGVCRVLVGEVTPRASTRFISVPEFEAKRRRLNTLIRGRFRKYCVPLGRITLTDLLPDGVHMNPRGTRKYMFAVMNAIESA